MTTPQGAQSRAETPAKSIAVRAPSQAPARYAALDLGTNN